MRMIEANDAKKVVVRYVDNPFYIAEASAEIDSIPKIDPVHAAGGCYCKECEFADETMRCQCDNSCKGLIRENEDFCSYGCRREGGE